MFWQTALNILFIITTLSQMTTQRWTLLTITLIILVRCTFIYLLCLTWSWTQNVQFLHLLGVFLLLQMNLLLLLSYFEAPSRDRFQMKIISSFPTCDDIETLVLYCYFKIFVIFYPSIWFDSQVSPWKIFPTTVFNGLFWSSLYLRKDYRKHSSFLYFHVPF